MTNNDQSYAVKTSLGNESKQIAKHSLVYGLGNVFNRVVGFVMIPVYTRYLIPSEYGILELLSLTTEIIGMILSMRISRAMNRFYFEYDSIQDKNEVIGTAMLSFGAIGFIGLSFASLASGFLAETILDSSQFSHYFIISFSTLWFNTVVLMAFNYLQILKKSALFIILSSVKLIIALSFNIYFIVFLKMGVLGILYGNLIASGSLTIILVIPVLIKVGIRFSGNKLVEMLKFGLPLIPGAIANFIVLVSDRYFVKIFGSLADTGIYSLSYKFGILPHAFITVPFYGIWSIRRFELMKSENAEELMGKIITYFFFIITFVGLGISVLAKDAIHIMADPKFWDACRYIPILILSYIVFSLYNHFSISILIQKKTKYISYIDVGNGILNVALNILLIRSYGIYGAAYATLISYTIRISSLYTVANRLQKIYFEFGRVGKIFLSAGLIFTICSLITISSSLISLLVKFIIALLFPLFLYVLNFYTTNEITKFKSVIASRSLKAALE